MLVEAIRESFELDEASAAVLKRIRRNLNVQVKRVDIGRCNQEGKRGKDMKTIKKVLALALALAMVVTAIPVTSAQAATTVKLSQATVKIAKGSAKAQSKTVTVTTPSTWKSVKVTATSNKKSVATVTVSGKKVKVKAVKKGSATVTVKVTGKKSNKSVKKTLKLAVKVVAASVKLTSAASQSLKVGDTAKVTVSKVPSAATVTYASDNAAVATVDNGTVTAVGAGTATITVSSNYGASVKTTVNVVEATADDDNTVVGQDGVTATLSNPFSTEYADTVLVGTPAVINVQVVKDGKAVSGETVVLTKVDGTGTNVGTYEVADNTAVTNSNGVATFVVKNSVPSLKSSDSAYVASVNYKVQVPSSGTEVNGVVNFASVSNAAIQNVNNHNNVTTDDLVPSTNYVDTARKGLGTTASMDEPNELEDEYVESQQVSTEGATEHEVTMTGGYPVITLPGTSSVVSDASKKVDDVNYTSGAYYTYENEPYYYELTESAAKLTYATVNFSNVTVSQYTQLVVETYASKAAALAGSTPLDSAVYGSDSASLNQSNINYQVKLTSGYEKPCVKITIKSAGQVNSAYNAGYTVKDVTYVYKTQTTTKGTEVAMKDATVEWAVASTPFTDARTMKSAEIAAAGLTEGSDTFTVALPAFPYTGTAVITEYDGNNKVVNYYAIATKNNGNNVNVIDDTAHAYQISSDELRENVGTITSQDGTNVTVNSAQSGRMNLVGTVKVAGVALTDAEYANVYTSVQWNPVPKTEAQTTSNGFVGLVGQKIEVVGQLTDKNGNAVSVKDKGITFKADFAKTSGTTVASTAIAKDDDKLYATKGSATVVSILPSTLTTDANGQVKLTLKASEVTELLNVVADSADSQYDAKITIAGQSTDQADLYWIDANLSFTDKVQSGTTKTTSTTDTAVTIDTPLNAKSGDAWIYGVQTLGTKIENGVLKNKTLTITGLNITMSKTSASVGTVETLANVSGAVKATSTKAGNMDITSKIDSSTLTSNVAISAGTFAGTGTTSISKKLTIKVTWEASGITASYINATGTKTTDDSKTVYLQVTDQNGNPVAGKTVTFKTDAGTVSPASATTDTNGIASTTVTAADTSTLTTSTVTAAVGGVSDNVFEQTVVLNATATTLALNTNEDQVNGGYLTNYDKDKKTITLTFDDDIAETSVVSELFTVKYGAKELVVDKASVDGNVITLTLKDVPSDVIQTTDTITVSVNKDTVKSVEYELTSLAGAGYNNMDITIYASNKQAPSAVAASVSP
jgi:hypothetical protein